MSRPTSPRIPRSKRIVSLALIALAVATMTTACLRPGQNEAWKAMNADRAALHLKQLPIDATAQAKAQAWAEHLARLGKLEHSHLPDGFARTRWCSIGENVGYGPNVGAVEKAYMNSPHHRDNIVATKWNKVGVGHAKAGNRVYTVQVFVRYC